MKFTDWLSGSSHAAPRRLAMALGDASVGAADLAILLRGALRAESLARGYAWEVELPDELAKKLSATFQQADLELIDGTSSRVRARVWQPTWLAHADSTEVDTVFLPAWRRPKETCLGDPILGGLDLTHYTSTAQRDAVRSVFCAAPGDTLAMCLPTGSGKSLCAFLPAMLPMDEENAARGVSVIVVPTVALGLDLESRLQARVGHQIAYRPAKKEEAEAIRHRCEAGVQGPLIVSPEALTGGLLSALRKAAKANWLRYFVIDEAHMVLSWGDEFRPAFLHLAALRRDLARRSQRGFVTLLMSATLTDYHLRWLRAMFAEEGRFRIVHAARLRPEPAYWMARAANEEERQRWIEEAIFRLPRPCIIYTTRRELCDRWYARLGELGFRRIGKMHGNTNDEARSRLLAEWNADKIDIVVATSAFGLGVDKQDVRTIIHAQLPESVDRFYQDVGRSGRDGRASASLLVTTPQDWSDVAGIGQPNFVTIQIGLDRWKRMYQERKTLETTPQTILIDLNAARELDMRGDYNRNWNVRTLQLLQRAGALEFVSHDEEDYDHAAVRPSSVPHTELEYWNDTIEPLRCELIADYQHTRRLLDRLVKPSTTCLAEQFKACYASKSFGLDVITACGDCPACRVTRLEPTCGKIIARRVPTEPLPGAEPSKELLRLLAGKPVALIGYPPRLEEAALGARLSELFWWLASQGVRNFVAQSSLETALRDLVTRGPHLISFLHHHPPRALDVTALQPTAVVLTRPEPTWWEEFHGTLHSRSIPTVLIAPSDLRCPDHPGRTVSDVLDGVSIELADWENRFVA